MTQANLFDLPELQPLPLEELNATARGVAVYLATSGPLTVYIAAERLRIRALAQEIFRLRKARYSIETERRPVINAWGESRTIAIYRMSEEHAAIVRGDDRRVGCG